jgi:hypothetical protein
MRSKNVLILAGETQEEYDETRTGWLEKYTPADYHETRLVEQLILNDWMLQRANNRLLEAEAAEWTAEQKHNIELAMRYKTMHERAFYRSLNALEGLRKDLLRENFLAMRVANQQKEKIEALEKDLAERPAKPAEAPVAKTQNLFCEQKSRATSDERIRAAGGMGVQPGLTVQNRRLTARE